MNDLVKLDGQALTVTAKKLENFKEKVKLKVSEIAPKLPSDYKKLTISELDSIEEKVSAFVKSISDTAKILKNERLEFTRELDNIKVFFTSAEKEITECISIPEKWINGYNSFKLELKREEEERMLKEQERLNFISEFKTIAKRHYQIFLLNFTTESLAQIQEEYYSFDEPQLLDFQNVNITLNVVVDRIKERLKNNLFSFDKSDNQMVEIHTEILSTFVKDLTFEQADKVIEKYVYLQKFIPSRIEQLKQNANKEADLETLKLKIEAEKLEAKKQIEEQAANDLLDEKINNSITVLETKKEIELSKGTTVKLKYQPTNHAELLKIIQYYIHNLYHKEDFEKLNSRLSFMRTACDSVLNNTGEFIENVPYSEEVKKRKI